MRDPLRRAVERLPRERPQAAHDRPRTRSPGSMKLRPASRCSQQRALGAIAFLFSSSRDHRFSTRSRPLEARQLHRGSPTARRWITHQSARRGRSTAAPLSRTGSRRSSRGACPRDTAHRVNNLSFVWRRRACLWSSCGWELRRPPREHRPRACPAWRVCAPRPRSNAFLDGSRGTLVELFLRASASERLVHEARELAQQSVLTAASALRGRPLPGHRTNARPSACCGASPPRVRPADSSSSTTSTAHLCSESFGARGDEQLDAAGP